jgi:urate oxidase-like protein
MDELLAIGPIERVRLGVPVLDVVEQGPRQVFAVLVCASPQMNVWAWIWPARKALLQRGDGLGPAPDASVALRAKHNVYMAAPLSFAMVSNHYPTIYEGEHSWVIMALLVLVGWAMTRLCCGRSFAAPIQRSESER